MLEFFQTSSRNLLAAAAGARSCTTSRFYRRNRPDGNGYFRAKVAQEKLIEAVVIPKTIVRATSPWNSSAPSPISVTMETRSGWRGPVSAHRVGRRCCHGPRCGARAPRSGIVEIAGPERAPLNEFVARYLKAAGDPREVVRDPQARHRAGRVQGTPRAVGRGAPRPHWSRFRMVPPLTGRHCPDPASEIPSLSLCGFRTTNEKRRPMTIKLVALMFLCLMTGTGAGSGARRSRVLMSKELPDNPGKEALMITVEHAPGGSERYPPAQCTMRLFLRAGGLRRHAAEGRTTGDTDTRTELL